MSTPSTLLAIALATATAATDPPVDLTSLLRVQHDVIARLYPPDERDGKSGVLGMVIRNGEVHVGHGSTSTTAFTRPLLLDLETGEALTVLPDGQRVELPRSYSDALQPFEMRTEGTIPFFSEDGVAYLDYDPLTSNSEVYILPGSEAPPRTSESGPVGHNRAAGVQVVEGPSGFLVVHNSGRQNWPSLSISTDNGYSWTHAHNVGAYPEPIGYCRFASFRGDLFVFTPIIGHYDGPGGMPEEVPNPAVAIIDPLDTTGDVDVRPLWERESRYWPLESAWISHFGGETTVEWPQLKSGHETAEGLYLVTTNGLFLTPDPERERPVVVPEAGELALYGAYGGTLYAVVEGRLRKFEDGAWTTLAFLNPSFELEHLTFSWDGELIVAGEDGDNELVLAYIPADELREAVPDFGN